MSHGATERQMAASDPGASVWVAASAGTGKTRVLTDRVLRLMLQGSSPAQILCLTFTRAAAAEMANRIHGDLARWATYDDPHLQHALVGLTGHAPSDQEMARARRLFAHVLDVPGGLKIQTIHAFCESLLSRFPLESGIAPHFSVIDERTSAELLNVARDDVLTRARSDTELSRALEQLTAQVSENRFSEIVREVASERGRLERLYHRYHDSFASFTRAIFDALGLAPEDDEASILEAACQLPDPVAAGLRAVAEAMTQGAKTDCRHGEAILNWLAQPDRRCGFFPQYSSAFFTADGSRRARLIHKDALDRAPVDAEHTLAAEAARLEAVHCRIKAAQTAADTCALLNLGYALIESYDGAKRRQALLDYDDLISCARNVLSLPGIAPWVLYKLDGGLDHVLIDEAQDTNDEQWQVVAALTEEFFAGSGARDADRTMFAVGDVKQSIYSFQRADPQLFAYWKTRFAERVTGAHRDWRPLALVHSYRSATPILSLVDEVFRVHEARAGLVFDDVEIDHISQRVGQSGLVELWATESPHAADETESWEPPVEQHHEATPGVRLANRMALEIKDWLDRGERLESRDRPIRPGDIMILVQRRAGFVEEMVRTLKQLDIPVAGTDRMVLIEQIAVMDLVSLGCFVVLPEDDLALAETLKSPFFGFDDEDLFDVAWDRNGESLWTSLRERQGRSTAYAAAVQTLGQLLAAADFMPPYEFFADLLGAGGGRRKLISRLGNEANDPIDEFLALCLQYERLHAPSLEGFLYWLVTGETDVKRDLELGRNEIRVLTVHGAKGLQAPIVFLPDTCRMPRDDNGIRWLEEDEDGIALPVWPARRDREDEVAQRAREAGRRRQEQESRRLLYVALTRAEDRLYIGGFEGVRGRPAGCWYDLIARAMDEIGQRGEDSEGREVAWLRTEQKEPPDRLDARAAPSTGGAPLPDWARSPARAEPSPPKPLTPSRPSEAEPPIRSPLGSDDGARFRRGRLIHRLLELLPEVTPPQQRRAAREVLSNPSHELGQAAQDEIIEVTIAVLENPEFAPVFGPGSRAEVAIAGVDGDYVVTGQIDRLLVSGDVVLVVDYKSDRPAPRSANEVAPAYLHQLSAYRAMLTRIYPKHSIRCALLWTDGPTLMEVDPDATASYVP